ncbi:uncharacterized protein LOC114536613 [Dendronephthya gigantea]|uniref:uncharacterized protein LOC114536613 n=1 Tax=Dendronephthya gigantea TaxID=151771 RepID=UPI00106CE073|nr:uncharacterized protein LOC114536613 [Dendronephthya gigantea]
MTMEKERKVTVLKNLQPGPTKDPKGRIRGPSCYTQMANPILVASGNPNADTVTHHTSQHNINIAPPKQPIGETPSPRENSPTCVSLIREQFENRGLSTTAKEVLEAAWRTGTRKQYEGYLGKWKQYCSEQNINPFAPTVEEGINFLADLFKKGLGYSALNTARSALSSIILLSNNTNFGTHPMVCRFLKGYLKVDHPYQGTMIFGMFE